MILQYLDKLKEMKEMVQIEISIASCNKNKIRQIELYTPSVKRRLETFEKLSEKLSDRKAIVEHPFGTIKYLMGKLPLLLRGLKKVTTEINIYVTAYNLKRLFNLEVFEDLVMKIGTYDWKAA